MSFATQALAQILSLADAAGMDQATLAAKAGLRPETISRAKRRGTIDLDSLVALARAVGSKLVVLPDAWDEQASPERDAELDIRDWQSPVRVTVASKIAQQNHQTDLVLPSGKVDASNQSPLAAPRYGLAWSNPNASPQALVINAIRRGGFQLILEAVFAHGLVFVKEKFAVISHGLSKSARDETSRIIKVIEDGLRDVEKRN